MTTLNLKNARNAIQEFDFKTLFIEELGWSNPPVKKSSKMTIEEFEFEQRPLAELGGVMVFEIVAKPFPDSKTRAAIHKEMSQYHHENLLIFVDQRPQPLQSIWYWVKRDNHKAIPREHYYFRGQSGDGLISKLAHLLTDLSEFDDDGHISVIRAVDKLRNALDVEKVTKRFYQDFEQEHLAFLQFISGIDHERDRKWYASVLLNRLMFIWFLQKKGFLEKGNRDYLPYHLQKSKEVGKNRFYAEFLQALFFEGFAKPQHERSSATQALLGAIPYLNGGLFLPHIIEQRWLQITIADQAFDNIFALFSRYSWSLDDSPGGQDNEINPDVLGYIFEKYINQKQFGAYYTRPEITEYLCTHTLDQLILDKVNGPAVADLPARQFASVTALLTQLDAPLCWYLLNQVLPQLKLLDPACGSGAFLVAAMKVLIQVYAAIIGKIASLQDTALTAWLSEIEKNHPNLNYFVKKQIITHNLFGVDIMEEATEIAKLRLFLALVSSAETVEQLEPLPNIDFNILSGNSLIGLLKVDGERFTEVGKTGDLFKNTAQQSYQQILAEKDRLIALYREASGFAPQHLQNLRDEINVQRQNSQQVLNQLLLQEFELLKIKFEQATWDHAKNKEGKAVKRPLTVADMVELHPFHWGYEFDEILSYPPLSPLDKRGMKGGFDAIVTNPPWEIFKPQAKEFVARRWAVRNGDSEWDLYRFGGNGFANVII